MSKRSRIAIEGALSTALIALILCLAQSILAQTLHLDETKPLTPDQYREVKQHMLDTSEDIATIAAEGELVKSVWSRLGFYLSPADQQWQKTVYWRAVQSPVINAFATRRPDRAPIIILTSGLYKYLDFLVASEVLGREYNARACSLAYEGYLMRISLQNAAWAEPAFNAGQLNQLSGLEVMAPEVFAENHLDICPNVTAEQLLYDIKGDKWSQQYQQAMGNSFSFVILHELGHIKTRDMDIPKLPGRLQQAKAQRRRETAADDFALKSFGRAKVPPLAALPIMFVLASLDSFATAQNAEDDHPEALFRFKEMVGASAERIKSPQFQKWAKEQGPETVQTADQFLDLLNHALN